MLKPQAKSMLSKALIPCPRGLFETIEGPLKVTHIIWMLWVSKTRRLVHKNSLLKMAVKKGVLHIELMNRPVSGDSLRTVRMVAGFTTGLHVSSQSMPCC